LKDLGEASYMNSILQCFCQIEKIVNYFKYNNRIIDIIKNKFKDRIGESLTYSFKNLVENLWPSNNQYILSESFNRNYSNQYFSPDELKKIIYNMKPLNKDDITISDLINYINYIISTLHEYLNKAPKNPNININIFETEESNNEQILQNFI
jgi:ubiquitin C-terminal hydrolase